MDMVNENMALINGWDKYVGFRGYWMIENRGGGERERRRRGGGGGGGTDKERENDENEERIDLAWLLYPASLWPEGERAPHGV